MSMDRSGGGAIGAPYKAGNVGLMGMAGGVGMPGQGMAPMMMNVPGGVKMGGPNHSMIAGGQCLILGGGIRTRVGTCSLVKTFIGITILFLDLGSR
jgi:hypothetical protein